MEKVRTALIGCGKVGHMHAKALSTLPESDFVAVCDKDLARAQAFAGQYHARAYTDVQEMVTDADVQAVVVCTPHPLHMSPAVLAAQAGAHVLVEKPLAASLRDCDAMLAAADEAGVKLGVISQRRLYGPVQRVKAAIEADKIGRPVLGTVVVLGWRDEAYYRSDPWRGRWDTEGGGVLVNQAPHQLDLLQWFMGPIDELFGYWDNLNHPYIEVEDTAVAVLRFKNGGLGSIVVSNSQRPGIYGKVHVQAKMAVRWACRRMAAPCSSPGCPRSWSHRSTTSGRCLGRSICWPSGRRRIGPASRRSTRPRTITACRIRISCGRFWITASRC